MALSKGHKLGPYEIESAAGAGGMGEVYKAKDTRLDRTVAIKVLPSHAALNADARTRFEREAKTISSLNHPNICTLHDVGNQDGIDYLVMEFLEGETLEDRLRRGKLDTTEALQIGAQIASGLYSAHRRGLIHRDLKPSNIYLTKEGAKLLDFGLAKLHAEAVAGVGGDTRTTPMTGEGAIVGTLQYMSPEQLEGKEADARSDIFAFGATLYEMMTGQRAFTGESKASLIGSIMKDRPRSITDLQPTSPPAVDRLIKKCLDKDPDGRWQSAGDLKDELEWIASAGSQAGIPRPVASRRRFRMRVAWVLVAVFGIAAIFLGVQRLMLRAPMPQTIRFSISKPENLTRIDWPLISPDGRYLAFLGYDSSGTSQIWIRPLNSRKAYPLPGTENITRPFWSPDSRYLAFFDQTREQLRKVPVSGGQPQLICRAQGTDGSWGTNNTILFDDYREVAIGQVSAAGGEPKLAATADTSAGERFVAWPYYLPDGRHFIYVARSDSLSSSEAAYLLKVGGIDGDSNKAVGQVDSRVVYCDPGFCLYLKRGFLVAHRLNLETLELEGEPVPLTDSISFAWNSNYGINASASATGALVWQPGGGQDRRLIWVDREGEEVDTIGQPADYHDLQIAPDYSRIAYTVKDPGSQYIKIEVVDLQRQTSSRLTFGMGDDGLPVWSPDSRMMAYVTDRSGNSTTLKRRSINGATSTIETSDSRFLWPLKWTDSDKLWYFDYRSVSLPRDTETYHIMTVDMRDTSHVDTVLTLSDLEVPFGLSPDNRYFLAGVYWGLDWGLYVHDLERPGGKWRLPEIGMQARWSPLGDEIFFFKDDDLMAQEVDLSNGFQFGAARKLFTRQRLFMGEANVVVWGYDVSDDAQRFLFITPGRTQLSGDIEVVLNWDSELEN
jgi:serine/threonine protein kinase